MFFPVWTINKENQEWQQHAKDFLAWLHANSPMSLDIWVEKNRPLPQILLSDWSVHFGNQYATF